jgi:nicotinamide riboside transporter PnuC
MCAELERDEGMGEVVGLLCVHVVYEQIPTSYNLCGLIKAIYMATIA